MPTDKPRFTITVDDALYEQIKDFETKNNCKSQTKAIIELIEKGFDVLAVNDPEVADAISGREKLTPDEKYLIDGYRSLNKDGQSYIRQTMEMALDSIRYKKIPDLSKLENQA